MGLAVALCEVRHSHQGASASKCCRHEGWLPGFMSSVTMVVYRVAPATTMHHCIFQSGFVFFRRCCEASGPIEQVGGSLLIAPMLGSRTPTRMREAGDIFTDSHQLQHVLSTMSLSFASTAYDIPRIPSPEHCLPSLSPPPPPPPPQILEGSAF